MFVGDISVEDGILDVSLQCTDFAAGREAEDFHDFLAGDGGLELADAVALLQVDEFLTHQLEVVEEALLALGILRGDVRFAEQHQVVNVVARLEEQTAHGTVRHNVVGYHDGAHVQPHELLHVLHLFVHGQLHAAEDVRYHLLAQVVVVVEGPPDARFPPF